MKCLVKSNLFFSLFKVLLFYLRFMLFIQDKNLKTLSIHFFINGNFFRFLNINVNNCYTNVVCIIKIYTYF